MPFVCSEVCIGVCTVCNTMKFNRISIIALFVFCLAASGSCVSSDADIVAKKLKTMEKDIPLPYNDNLLKRIDRYASKTFSNAFTEYDTFVETELTKRGMPLELRCLPLALSDMRTYYLQDDRRGIWALPVLVGLRYGLDIDETDDERLSMQASTCAALDYLSDLHAQYGDWWYSILAYANSPNSLQRALVRNGDSLAVWDFYEQDLMPDVSIISDFIASVYVYNEGKLKLGEVLEIQPDNSSEKPKQEIAATEKPKPAPQPAKPKETTIKYTVKKGDTLTKIASKHHVSVANLKKWNKLRSDMIREGQKLIIKQ